MELLNVDKGGDELKMINEDSKITVEELKKLNELKLGELAATSAKERTLGVPVKPADGASYEEQKNYEVAKNAYDNKVVILDKFDNGVAKLKESYAASKEALLKDSKDELAKLEAAIGIAKPEAAKVETVVAPATEKKDGKPAETPAAKPEAAKVETPATAPAETKEAPKTAEYVVKKGDNLTKIAREHGTTVDALVKENGIKDKNHILVGQKLKVPAKAETKPATDAEAAKAAAKPAEAEKKADGKPADAPKGEKKADAPATKGEADVKAAAKADVPPPATATVAEKAKVTTPNPEPTKVAHADIQAPIGGSNRSAADGDKK